jgi:transcriptional regulator with XRE-family HTH domain
MTMTAGTAGTPTWTLGERLAKARRHAGLDDQEAFARVLGISRRTVSRYETGLARPNRRTLMAWARVCQVPLEWLDDAGTDHASTPSAWMVAPRRWALAA